VTVDIRDGGWQGRWALGIQGHGPLKAALTALAALALGLTACGRAPYRVVWSRPADGRGVFAVAAVDLNHDAFGDLLIGDSHGAVAYFGSPHGLSDRPDWAFDGLPPEGVGFKVGSAGHLGPGPYPVIYIASPRVGGRGAVYLFRTGPHGPEARPWKVLWSPAPGEGFGERVAAVGDLYGDGYDDLAVGDFGFDHHAGKVYIYRGGPGGPGPEPAWSCEGEKPGDWFGYSLCGPGDLDHDGFADLVVGSKNCNGSCLAWMQGNPDLVLDQGLLHSQAWAQASTQPTSGRLSVFYGSRRGLAAKPGLVMEGTQTHELFAYDLESAGDLLGDGHACFLSGSLGWKDKRGLVQIFEGGPQGSLHELWRKEGSLATDGLGFRQKVVDAVTGPGSRDLILVGLGDDQDWLLRDFLSRQGSPRQTHLLVGGPTQKRLSYVVGSAGDLQGDGKSELYVLVPGEKGPLQILKYY
jgi:hypothetical protein